MLYAAWTAEPFRTTRDLDLLSFGEREAERFVMIFRDICVQPVEEDGLVFDAEHIVAAPIRDGREHGGLRLRTSAHLATAVIPVQVDIGFGDAVTPGPLELEYPVLLDQPAPTLNAYPRDTVAAEKFEAIVALDLANSRMKDFYDLLAMSRLFTFPGETLAAAIRATFERRATNIPREHPPSLTGAFSDDPQKVQQWRLMDLPPSAISLGMMEGARGVRIAQVQDQALRAFRQPRGNTGWGSVRCSQARRTRVHRCRPRRRCHQAANRAQGTVPVRRVPCDRAVSPG